MTEFRFPPLKLKQCCGTCGGDQVATSSRLPPGVDTFHHNNHPGIVKRSSVSGICDYTDPGHSGPFKCVFEKGYSIPWSKDTKEALPARLYMPGTSWNGLCLTATGPFPLVVILHAFGVPGFKAETYHLAYAVLAQHLASHGFIVAVLNRRTDKPNYPVADNGDIIEEHVHHLFTKEVSAQRLQNSVALIGHSSGGEMVIKNAHRISKPLDPSHVSKNLNAVALMATTVPTMSVAETVAFGNVTGAFMGLMNSSDGDTGAYGPKDDNMPMRSVLGIYDVVGVNPLSPISSAEKDMVYMKVYDTVLWDDYTHFFQDKVFARAYIAAFLNRHLYGNTSYVKVLKYGEIPASVKATLPSPDKLRLHREHSDRIGKLVVADFESFPNLIQSTYGISFSVGPSYILDDFSAHNTNVLRISWDKTTAPGKFSKNILTINFIKPYDLSKYSHLSLRICQAYPGIEQDLDVGIQLSEGAMVLLSAYGPKLRQPPHFAVGNKSAIKNVMETYLIPLGAFGVGTTLSKVTHVNLDFSVNPASKATFFVDSIEFLQDESGSCA